MLLKNIYKYIALILVVSATQTVYAQDCTQKLEQAQQAFENGQIELIPTLLTGCIESNYVKLQLSQAYKLLVLTHLYDNEPQKAEEAMLELLRHDPLFEVDPVNDPSEFIHLYNQFRTDPIVMIGVNVGVNTQIFNVIKSYGPENQTTAKESYGGTVGLLFGVGAEYPINKRWAATGDLNFVIRKIKIENSSFDFNSLEVEESQNWVDLTLMGKYYLKDMNAVTRKDGIIIPFAKLGATMNYLLGDDARITTTQQDLKDIKGPSEDFVDFKNKFQFGVIGAGGAEYHFGRNIILLTANFQFMFGDLVDSDSRGSQEAIRILNKYGYQENDYKAHTFSLVASYRLKIFNPKKLSE